MKLYKELLQRRFTIKECLYPCKFIKIFFQDKIYEDFNVGQVIFYFNKFIRTTKSRYSYGALELLAEFGGYMGLFLGISVFQLKDGFNKLFEIIS